MVWNFFNRGNKQNDNQQTNPPASSSIESIQPSSTSSEATTSSILDQTLTINKWIKLIEAFNSVYSEHKPKLSVIEELKIKNVNIETKQENIEGHTATAVLVDDLFFFSGISNYGSISKIEAISKTVDYLINLRNFIAKFKSVFGHTKYNPEVIVSTLIGSHPEMIQKTTDLGNAENLKTITITITNLASVTESELNENEAFKTASFKLCEYLRRIAQIGHLDMIDILLQSNRPSSGASQITFLNLNEIHKLANKPESNIELEANRGNNSTIQDQITNPTCNFTDNFTNKGQNTISAQPSKTIINKSTSTNQNLVDKWIALIGQFNLVYSPVKSKWEILHELRNKGHRIYLRTFPAQNIVSDDNKIIHHAKVEIETMFIISGNGKTEKDANDNALSQMMRFFKNLDKLAKDFKNYVYSPTKSPSEIVECLIPGRENIFKLVQKQINHQWSTTAEIVNVIWFTELANDAEMSKHLACEKTVDYLKLLSQMDEGGKITTIVEAQSEGNFNEYQTNEIKINGTKIDTKILRKSSASQMISNLPNQSNQTLAKETRIEDLILLIDRFNCVNSRDKKKPQLIKELKLKGQYIFTDRMNLPTLDNNRPIYHVTHVVDIKNIIRFESSPEEIIESKRDSLDKAIWFLNDLTQLVETFKSRYNPSKCSWKMICILLDALEYNKKSKVIKILNHQHIEICKIVTFMAVGQKEIDRGHSAASQAIDFLKKLAKIDHSESNVETGLCDCSNSTNQRTNNKRITKQVNGAQRQPTNQSNNKDIQAESDKQTNNSPHSNSRNDQKLPFKNETHISDNKQVEQSNELIKDSVSFIDEVISIPKLIELIRNFTLVNSKDKLKQTIVDEFNEISNTKIAISTQSCHNQAKNKNFKTTVDIDNVFNFVSLGKTEYICRTEALNKTIRFLKNLSHLANNFRNDYPWLKSKSALQMIDLLIPRNHEMINVKEFSLNSKNEYSVKINISYIATFTGKGKSIDESKQNAALKAIDYLKKLAQIGKPNKKNNASNANKQKPGLSRNMKVFSTIPPKSNSLYVEQ